MPRIAPTKSRILTVEEVAQFLRVHPSTIYKMLKKKQLPAFRVGSDWRFAVEALEKWLGEAASGSMAARNSHRQK